MRTLAPLGTLFSPPQVSHLKGATSQPEEGFPWPTGDRSHCPLLTLGQNAPCHAEHGSSHSPGPWTGSSTAVWAYSGLLCLLKPYKPGPGGPAPAPSRLRPHLSRFPTTPELTRSWKGVPGALPRDHPSGWGGVARHWDMVQVGCKESHGPQGRQPPEAACPQMLFPDGSRLSDSHLSFQAEA